MANLPSCRPWPPLGLVRDKQDDPLMDEDELDRQILAEIQLGDLARFDGFVDRYKTRLFRFLYMRAGDRDVAEDLTQEVFLKLLGIQAGRGGMGMGKGRGEDGGGQAGVRGRVSTWVFTIARNCLVDYYRAQKRRKRADGLIRLLPRDSTLDPVTCAAFEEERVRVGALLAGLPEEQREVVLLRMFGDLPLGEIATITQVPLPTVKSRLRYALDKISTLLPKEAWL